MKTLKKIITGGQTGVDRAALDVALIFNFPCGGWCPKGRLAEDGKISLRYPLVETSSIDYEQRTRLNVKDSDATLILTQGYPKGGTALTLKFAKELNKSALIIDFNHTQEDKIKRIKNWITKNQIQFLNIAGPRASKLPEIYDLAKELLEELLNELR